MSTERGNRNAHFNLIYGNNGSGKTTILSLLFHLLSTGDKRGHRSFLAKVPFSRFAVTFSNGSRLEATRERKEITGSYLLSFKENHHYYGALKKGQWN